MSKSEVCSALKKTNSSLFRRDNFRKTKPIACPPMWAFRGEASPASPTVRPVIFHLLHVMYAHQECLLACLLLRSHAPDKLRSLYFEFQRTRNFISSHPSISSEPRNDCNALGRNSFARKSSQKYYEGRYLCNRGPEGANYAVIYPRAVTNNKHI